MFDFIIYLLPLLNWIDCLKIRGQFLASKYSANKISKAHEREPGADITATMTVHFPISIVKIFCRWPARLVRGFILLL